MPGIGIITNPKSRQNRKHPENMNQLGYIVGDEGACAATKNLDDIYKVAEVFKKYDIDVLGLNGGDGTNHITLTKFIEVYKDKPLPKIAFLRGGTMNTISDSCGIKGTPQKILYNLVEKYHLNQPFITTHRDMLKFGDKYGFIFGNGIVTNFMSEYYSYPEPSPWVALKLSSRVISHAAINGPLYKMVRKSLKAQVTVDDKKWNQDYYTGIFASTIHEIGLGFTPFRRCEDQPGSFHVLGVTCSLKKLITMLPRIWFGGQIRRDYILEDVASKLVIYTEEEADYTIDGDIYKNKGELLIETGPRLEIIVS